MKLRETVIALFAGIAGSVITFLGSIGVMYFSISDQHSQAQLTYFRDHAIRDAILASHNLDDIYEECLNFCNKISEKNKDSSSNKDIVSKMSLYNDNMDLLKMDFAYFKINSEDVFFSSDGYIDNLRSALSISCEKGKRIINPIFSE